MWSLTTRGVDVAPPYQEHQCCVLGAFGAEQPIVVYVGRRRGAFNQIRHSSSASSVAGLQRGGELQQGQAVGEQPRHLWAAWAAEEVALEQLATGRDAFRELLVGLDLLGDSVRPYAWSASAPRPRPSGPRASGSSLTNSHLPPAGRRQFVVVDRRPVHIPVAVEQLVGYDGLLTIENRLSSKKDVAADASGQRDWRCRGRLRP